MDEENPTSDDFKAARKRLTESLMREHETKALLHKVQNEKLVLGAELETVKTKLENALKLIAMEFDVGKAVDCLTERADDVVVVKKGKGGELNVQVTTSAPLLKAEGELALLREEVKSMKTKLHERGRLLKQMQKLLKDMSASFGGKIRRLYDVTVHDMNYLLGELDWQGDYIGSIEAADENGDLHSNSQNWMISLCQKRKRISGPHYPQKIGRVEEPRGKKTHDSADEKESDGSDDDGVVPGYRVDY